MRNDIAQQIESLRKKINGSVIIPGDTRYDVLRVTHFNRTALPAVIVMCALPEDVAETITFARKHMLVISVRSGGHSGAGWSTNNGGVVIDVTAMHSVEVLDARRRLVRVGAGATWGEVAEMLTPQGLALTSGDMRTVGVAGLTLGGGIGWMVRKYGFTVDALVAATIVTADGKMLRTSEAENPELFWAIRGAGTNFGVVTAFEFIAQPIKEVIGGSITYVFNERRNVLKAWANYMRTAPRELTTIAHMMGNFRPKVPPQLEIGVCYAGDSEVRANEAIQPLLEFGTVVSKDIAKMPYSNMLEEAMGFGDMKVRVHNGFTPKLSDELIDGIVDNFALKKAPIIQIRSLGGAADDISEDAMAFCHRGNEGFIVVPTFSSAETSESEVLATADKAWAPIKPFMSGAYCNFFTDSRIETLMEGFSAETYERLSKLKYKYDPKNTFSQNANIAPSA